MKEHDRRIAIRLPASERVRVEQMVQKGRFKNVSQVIRQAIKEFVEE